MIAFRLAACLFFVKWSDLKRRNLEWRNLLLLGWIHQPRHIHASGLHCRDEAQDGLTLPRRDNDIKAGRAV